MSTKKQETALVEKPAEPTRQALALIKPPESLGGRSVVLSEEERAFMEATGEQPQGPTKMPFIKINHRDGVFEFANGNQVDGDEGVQGFFIAQFTNRAYYAKDWSPTGERLPPDCKSADCVAPDDDINPASKQSDMCATCKWNTFGSAKVGKGKACKERLWLFLVNPEFGDPPVSVLILPPSALGKFYGSPMKQGYFDLMKSKHRAWQIVWNKITLYREKREDIHYSVRFEMGDRANLNTAKEIAAIFTMLKDAIVRTKYEVAPADDGEIES